MGEGIKQFFIDNQSSIIVSLIIGAIFFILGPLGLWFSGKKVKKEKINKAKSDFLDLVESMLVNKENITISKLVTLFGAIERQNGISLGLDSDINNLLEDLSLRFARSKHLSSEQKNTYSDEIDGLIKQLSKVDDEDSQTVIRELPKSVRSIVNEIRKEAESSNSDKLIEKIDLLEKHLTKPSDPFLRMITILRETPKLNAWISIYYVATIVIVFIIQYLLEK
ncbi:hypothetical protein [Zobellia alginiliquefaciens]|uniref:hypothetical protein n=1 Tax=Zobellia alginiliquefaciens TaxID=3032586 RepID=UPI0023E36065|nr:hypothetical protein [Zobellia alginiliquefaciens]